MGTHLASVTRTPTGAELQCAICRSPNDIDIDHIRNRGAGGSKERDVPENKIPLCRGHHTAKTVGTIKTWVKDGVYHWRKRDSNLVFRVPVAVSERYGCLVPCDGAELQSNVCVSPSQQGSAPSQAGEGEDAANSEIGESKPSPATSAGDQQRVTPPGGLDGKRSPALAGAGGGSGSVPSTPVSPGSSPAPFSLEEWTKEGDRLLTMGLQLKDLTDEWRFSIGDWVAQGEENLGEEAYGHFSRFEDAFGASYLRGLGWVAASVTRETRQIAPSWSHARTVAKLDEKAQRAALITAREEGLSTRELAVLVAPERPEREKHACPLCKLEHWALVSEEWK